MIKTVLITGASSGLGEALSYRYAASGYRLVLVARDSKRLENVADNCRQQYAAEVVIIVLDLLKPNAIDHLLSSLDEQNLKIDILINNAGLGCWGEFTHTELDTENAMIHLHIQVLVTFTKKILQRMHLNQRGHIINIASIYSATPVPYQAVYAASKSFMLSFSQALSYELRKTNICVSCVCPGSMPTRFRSTVAVKEDNAFHLPPIKVADYIYQQALKKKRLIIPGGINQLFFHIANLLPYQLLLPIVCWIVYVLRPLSITKGEKSE